MRVDSKKLLLLISLGSILEYYDFAIFIYLAPVIGKSLIPVKNEIVNLILSYAIFAIGALFRPLGGMIFGHVGDTRGRKHTFVYTILLMAVPTFLIALIPSANVIGIWATALLIFLRVTQGMALGGEIPGSIVFGYELSSQKRKAINASFIIMGTNFGFFGASIVATMVLANNFAVFESWRLAFILGGVFGIVSYFLRKSLTETPAFAEYKNMLEHETVPVKLLFAEHKKPILQMLGIGAFLATSLSVYTYYMPAYLSQFHHFPMKKLMEFNSYTIFIFVLGSLIAGVFDKYFGRLFLSISAFVFGITVLILFNNYGALSLNQIFIIHTFILFGIGVTCGRLPVICATFFPISVRYSGVAFIYNVSFGIWAGCTQMLLTWLIKISGFLWVPGAYLAIFASVALISLYTIKPKQLVEYQA